MQTSPSQSDQVLMRREARTRNETRLCGRRLTRGRRVGCLTDRLPGRPVAQKPISTNEHFRATSATGCNPSGISSATIYVNHRGLWSAAQRVGGQWDKENCGEPGPQGPSNRTNR